MIAINPLPGTLMTRERLAEVLVTLGCPLEKSAEMADQLDRRAKQLAKQRRQTHAETMAHLLGLMQQGWAAPPSGFKN